VLSDTKGSVQFDPPTDDKSMGRASIASSDLQEDSTTFDTVPLDSYVPANSVPKPNVVKIDVEGAEQLVLEGMENLPRSHTAGCNYVKLDSRYSTVAVR